MSSLKPIIVWGHNMGPNPLKVHIILEELNIPFEFKTIEFPEMKQEPYITVNPNGRVPAIEDPNTGVTLWEVSFQRMISAADVAKIVFCSRVPLSNTFSISMIRTTNSVMILCLRNT